MSQQPENILLHALLDRLQIQAWDVFIVGDGSGCRRDAPCGWASVLIDCKTRQRMPFCGVLNAGSINLAESMPYFQAMCWYDVTCGRKELETRGTVRCHILTDSQVVATWGNRAADVHAALPDSYRPIWGIFREWVRDGYQFHFHWADRNTTSLNNYCDLVAGLSRKSWVDGPDLHVSLDKTMTAIKELNITDPSSELSPYTINPG